MREGGDDDGGGCVGITSIRPTPIGFKDLGTLPQYFSLSCAKLFFLLLTLSLILILIFSCLVTFISLSINIFSQRLKYIKTIILLQNLKILE